MDDGIAEDRGGDVGDPHGGDHGDEHICEEDGARAGACFGEDESGEQFGDVVFGEGGRDGEAPEKEHYDRGPHGGEDVLGGFFGGHAAVGVFCAADIEDHDEEGDEKGGDEEGDDFCCPEETDEDD